MNSIPLPLKVLVVEDSENDALLLEIELQRAGYEPECVRVETAEAMRAALERGGWDLIIADYVLPRFDGLGALALVRKCGVDVPFIVVSGHITDATAVAAMKAGAHDYVMKDNLARLGAAVQRELSEAAVRRARSLSEEKLQAESAFREAIESSVPSGISVVDLQGRQVHVNPAFCALVGWNERDLVGAAPPFVYWPPAEVPVIQATLARFSRNPDSVGGAELRFVRRDGQTIDVLFQTTPLKDSAGRLTGWVSSATNITLRKRAEEALRRAHDELESRVRERTAELQAANIRLEASIAERRRLERELLEITEKERRRIGLDLHDDLGQKLSGVALMTKGLELKLAKQGSADSVEAGRIHLLVQQAMNHASDLAHDMATLDLKNKELPEALADLAAQAGEMFGIACDFKSEGAIPALDSDTVNQLYKITQEAVTNAIKHGKTKRIGIHLSNGEGRLTLNVENTGKPFPDLKSRSTGMGLRIMNYRAHLVGASLEIKSAGIRGGTRVTCVVPTEGILRAPGPLAGALAASSGPTGV